VNEHAADAGDVLKHLLLAQVLHLERGRIAVYMDTHAGRPWNDLTQPGYRFCRERRRGPAWADEFMEAATSGALGRQVLEARYTALLRQTFSNGSTLASPPVYPGSVGIACELLSGDAALEWFCGEQDRADRNALARELPKGAAIWDTLLAPTAMARVERLRRCVRPETFVLVDPFRLAQSGRRSPDWYDALCARRFTVQAARQGALVMAWYALHRPGTPAIIEKEIWDQLTTPPLRPTRCLKLEIRWSQSNSQALSGAGLIIANLARQDTAHQLDALAGALEPLYSPHRNAWSKKFDRQ
jgi:23S rRNA A2030 N6-methylase RlmJ